MSERRLSLAEVTNYVEWVRRDFYISRPTDLEPSLGKWKESSGRWEVEDAQTKIGKMQSY